MFDSVQPYGLQSTRLFCPWDVPARIPAQAAMPSSRGSSNPGSQPSVFHIYLHWQVGSVPVAPPGKPDQLGTEALDCLAPAHTASSNRFLLEKGHPLAQTQSSGLNSPPRFSPVLFSLLAKGVQMHQVGFRESFFILPPFHVESVIGSRTPPRLPFYLPSTPSARRWVQTPTRFRISGSEDAASCPGL